MIKKYQDKKHKKSGIIKMGLNEKKKCIQDWVYKITKENEQIYLRYSKHY